MMQSKGHGCFLRQVNAVIGQSVAQRCLHGSLQLHSRSSEHLLVNWELGGVKYKLTLRTSAQETYG